VTKIPKFLLYGEGDVSTEEMLQPALPFREWNELSSEEKQTAFQELKNSLWVEDYSVEILETISYLNHNFLRQSPGKNLHAIQPSRDYRGGGGNDFERMHAAVIDFKHIFLSEESDGMVYRMLTKFAEAYIDSYYYQMAKETKVKEEKEKYLEVAFEKFDPLANCLNHIFEQFAVNQILTRSGLIPRQDKKIVDGIYIPTLKILADPKWISVNAIIAQMFDDYREKDYPEVITKAHSAVQKFLQILVDNGDGKNGKGELGKLFTQAKQSGLIPVNRFTEQIINVFQAYISSERATNSTAKPALSVATSADALLMMNVVMTLLQFCLQKAE
jgi:HEPN domain-containing protein